MEVLVKGRSVAEDFRVDVAGDKLVCIVIGDYDSIGGLQHLVFLVVSVQLLPW